MSCVRSRSLRISMMMMMQSIHPFHSASPPFPSAKIPDLRGGWKCSYIVLNHRSAVPLTLPRGAGAEREVKRESASERHSPRPLAISRSHTLPSSLGHA